MNYPAASYGVSIGSYHNASRGGELNLYPPQEGLSASGGLVRLRRIKAGDTLTGVVFPLKMLARLSLNERARLGESRPEDQFAMGPLPQGKNGMLLTVRADGKIIQETVVFEIGMTPMNYPPK